MPEIVSLTLIDRIGLIVIDYPPVNILSAPVRAGILDALQRAIADPGSDAIVIACAGRTFIAGADIAEFGQPLAEPSIQVLLAAIEASPKPVVAAIHGTALGGGFELALCCSYRIAARSAHVGLPEVHLGILPGAGGTQRLPRLIGADLALEVITSGRRIDMAEAHRIGVIDELVDDADLREWALAYARAIAPAGPRRIRDLEEWPAKDRADPGLFQRFLDENAGKFRGFKAPAAIVSSVEAAVTLPFEAGLALEAALCTQLIVSEESAAQRAYFFAEREAPKIAGIPKDVQAGTIDIVAIIGAGTMGTGIAIACLNAGLRVVLIDTSGDVLVRGCNTVRKSIETMVARGRLARHEATARLDVLTASQDMSEVAQADLVIEAVFESMALKQQIFEQLDVLAKPGAILASNTSFLDIDAIAAATRRPGNVLGLHFFSPAHIMRLLEIIRGRMTEPQVLATAFAFARRIGKIGVLSGVCDGFIANRLMLPRALQAERMALEGTPISEIDRVLVDYGFPMGHFQMMDLAGLDVVARASKHRTAASDLVVIGRLGQKSGAGYYDYDDKRRPIRSDVVSDVMTSVARELGIPPRPTVGDEAILDRLLLPVMNEGRKILDEGIALRASDIDVVAVQGYGWPAYRGGPMFEAERMGVDRMAERLRRIERI